MNSKYKRVILTADVPRTESPIELALADLIIGILVNSFSNLLKASVVDVFSVDIATKHYLLIQRTNNGIWQMPSGKVNSNESAWQAAITQINRYVLKILVKQSFNVLQNCVP